MGGHVSSGEDNKQRILQEEGKKQWKNGRRQTLEEKRRQKQKNIETQKQNIDKGISEEF